MREGEREKETQAMERENHVPVHVTRQQLEAIRASLKGHWANEGNSAQSAAFLDTIMLQLQSAVVVDDNSNQDTDTHSQVDESISSIDRINGNELTEPYDFALNDTLRDTYRSFERLVEDTAIQRQKIPVDLAKQAREQLAADLQSIKDAVEHQTHEANRLLDTLQSDFTPDSMSSSNSNSDPHPHPERNTNTDTAPRSLGLSSAQLLQTKQTTNATKSAAETFSRAVQF